MFVCACKLILYEASLHTPLPGLNVFFPFLGLFLQTRETVIVVSFGLLSSHTSAIMKMLHVFFTLSTFQLAVELNFLLRTCIKSSACFTKKQEPFYILLYVGVLIYIIQYMIQLQGERYWAGQKHYSSVQLCMKYVLTKLQFGYRQHQ